MRDNSDYLDFLRAKVAVASEAGLQVEDHEVNPILKPHQRAIVRWAIAGGRRAIFAAFGLGKSVIQLEIVRIVMAKTGGLGLITIPLGVRPEFMRDAAMLGIPVRFIRTTAEAEDPAILYLTNYESVREGKIDPLHFTVSSLDEAAVLRGFGGTKTFREFMRLFAGDDRTTGIKSEGVKYRFVATAVPSPNDYIELLAYSAYLDVMEVGQAKTRFFKRNSEKADQLTIHAHKEEEFWLWVATWALFVQKPSDIDPAFSDEGYELPALDVRWHEIPGDHRNAGAEKDGQGRLFQNAAIGVQDAARVKRESLPARVAKLIELRAEDPGAHRIIWHDLEDERRAIEAAVPDVVTVYGSQELEAREASVIAFSNGKIRELAGKPVMLGSGCNFQRYCWWAIYLGIGFKFSDWIQSVHRLHRFLQTRTVRIDLIYTEAERDVRRSLRTQMATARGDGGKDDSDHPGLRAGARRGCEHAGAIARRGTRRGFGRRLHRGEQRLRDRDAGDGRQQRRPNRHEHPVREPVRIHPELQRLRAHRRQRALLEADGLPDAGAAARAAGGPRCCDPRQGPDHAGRHQRPRLPDGDRGQR
ncbi:hypothetical protein GCM10027432_24510 [Lysobacter fragariae]